MKILKYTLFSLLLTSLISCGSYRNFTKTQQQLITSADGSKPMRVFLITNKQDSILLRTKSSYINPNPKDKTIRLLAKRLYSTVRDSMSLGVGIAAPQVGVLKQMICVQRFDKKDFPFEIYLNPVIKQYSKQKRPCPEGCLSIPNKRGKTFDRAYTILIEYDKLDGTHHFEMIEDFTSVIFQHEIDHLHGILFIDHLKNEGK